MLTPTPQMILISHRPKLAPATLRAATQPVPKKINRAVPRNSARHWLDSMGWRRAVVMYDLVFCCEARGARQQSPVSIPIDPGQM